MLMSMHCQFRKILLQVLAALQQWTLPHVVIHQLRLCCTARPMGQNEESTERPRKGKVEHQKLTTNSGKVFFKFKPYHKAIIDNMS